MDYELIKVETAHDGAATVITLGPAPANILSAKMMSEISAQLEADAADPHKKLIVFKGEGKHFSFGASVEEHKPGEVDKMLPAFHEFVGKVINCPVPTCAMVTGQCLGGAFELVLACSFIFADETAKMGVPEIQLAVLPPVASILLPVRAGDLISTEMILTGRSLSAAELKACGLVNEVAEPGALDEFVGGFFEKHLAPRSASSLRIAHRGARMYLAKQYRKFIGKLEKLYLEDLMSTADAVEGITAFLEKRKPEWKDR